MQKRASECEAPPTAAYGCAERVRIGLATHMLPIIDAHLDLAYLAQQGVDLTQATHDRRRFGVNLPSLRSAGVRLAFGTIFTEWVDAKDHRALQPWEYAGPDDAARAERVGLDQLGIYNELWTRGLVRVVLSSSALHVERDSAVEGALDAAPLQVLLLMEGADPLRTPDDLAQWCALGVRAIGLSWARGSRYAGGNAQPGPLTALGRALLDAMHDQGAILDLSHLSDESFDQALDHFDGPVMASHSNARALLEPSQRHLRDDQALRIADRGGVIGLNLYGRFLASGRRATIEDAVRHLQHWRSLIGVAHIGLGSDLDGGFGPDDCAEGLARPEEVPTLFDALRRAGWSETEVEAVASQSWLDFLRRSLPV